MTGSRIKATFSMRSCSNFFFSSHFLFLFFLDLVFSLVMYQWGEGVRKGTGMEIRCRKSKEKVGGENGN